MNSRVLGKLGCHEPFAMQGQTPHCSLVVYLAQTYPFGITMRLWATVFQSGAFYSSVFEDRHTKSRP